MKSSLFLAALGSTGLAVLLASTPAAAETRGPMDRFTQMFGRSPPPADYDDDLPSPPVRADTGSSVRIDRLENQVRSLTGRMPDGFTELHRKISPAQSLSVQANVGAHFAERKRIYPFPHLSGDVDAVVLHLENPFSPWDHAPFGNPYGIVAPCRFIEDALLFMSGPKPFQGWLTGPIS